MRSTLIILIGMSVLTASANEGMWVPQQLNEIAEPLKKMGLQLDPNEFADLTGNPMGAVVSLGGCTASFISPNGLVATNHHCAYGGIQLNSTPENNLLTNGFIANQLVDEVSAGPNSRIFVMDSIQDVTEQMRQGLVPKMSGLDRQKMLEKSTKEIVAACESEPGFICNVYSFFGGVQYRLFKQIEIKDVRLSYAPPSSIGNYGGEVDNWMWPRHAGDFTLIRAYVGKDGKPAAFSKDNIPYQNKQWLKVSNTPLVENDFVMVAGYPGRTNRYALSVEFDNTQNWTYPNTIQNLTNVRDLVHAASKSDKDIEIKYASTVKSWENVLKNNAGQLIGFQKSNAELIKRNEEQAVLTWLKSQGKYGKTALDAHSKLVGMHMSERSSQEKNGLIGQVSGMSLLGTASRLYRLAIENEKPNIERSPGFQERDVPRIEGSVRELQNRYSADMEKQLMMYWLNKYIALPVKDRNAVIDQWLAGNDSKSITNAVNNLYGNTQLGQLEQRQKLLKASRAEFEASSDAMVKLAVALYPGALKTENTNKERGGEIAKYRPIFMEAITAYKKSKGESVYPDANGSLRLTFGNVTGYNPKDGVAYTPFTTAQGMAEKATKNDPFDAPQTLLDQVANKNYGSYKDDKLGTLPVNFLSNLDITGGNSGSPVMNAKGQLVGLAFDGNWESVSSSWIFDGSLNRMISVDSRYMMWIMDTIYPAPSIVSEIKKASK